MTWKSQCKSHADAEVTGNPFLCKPPRKNVYLPTERRLLKVYEMYKNLAFGRVFIDK